MICKLCSSAIKIFLTRQFFTFSFFGLVALLINLGARLALNLFFSFSISVFLAHIFAMGCAYFLFQTYVFRSYRNFKSSLFKFLIINFISLIQVWTVSYFMAYFILPSFGFSEFLYLISHLFGVFSTVITSFVGHKYWSFRR